MSTLIHSLATISAAVAVVKTVRWYADYAYEQSLKAKREAFRHYVETGEKTTAYCSLSSRAVKAARRQRRNLIVERTKESGTFSTICQCPKCLSVDLHNIQFLRRGKCTRQCQSCYYTWSQR